MNKKLFKKRAKEALRSYTKEELMGIDFDNPTVEMLEEIADMGEVSVDWLLGRDEKDIIKRALMNDNIHYTVDELAGKELAEFSKWARNYIVGEITEEKIRELYPEYRKYKKTTSRERFLVGKIYQETIIETLCRKN